MPSSSSMSPPGGGRRGVAEEGGGGGRFEVVGVEVCWALEPPTGAMSATKTRNVIKTMGPIFRRFISGRMMLDAGGRATYCFWM